MSTTQTARTNKPTHARRHTSRNRAQLCEYCSGCVSCDPDHACSPAPAAASENVDASELDPREEAHYAAFQEPDEPYEDPEPPGPSLSDYCDELATREFMEAALAPDQALVIKYARLLVSGDADKMRGYTAFTKTRIEFGIHPRATALFEDLVADRVGRHFHIAGRTVPPELSSNPYEFQRAYDLRDRPRTGWLVDQILMERGFTVLYGPPGCGKSFVALDWAMSIVHGVDWQGRETMVGAVGYVAAEGAHEFGPRIAAWQQEHGCSGADIEREQFYVLGTAPDLMKNETAQKLAMATWTIPNLKLIIVDTMARTMYDGDENAARDVGKFIANIEMLRFATDAAILVIHHTTKSTGDVRGSSALPGAATTMLSLVSPKGSHGGLILSCEKQKEAAAFDPPINLQRADITLDDGETSCVIREAVSLFPQVDSQTLALRVLDTEFGTAGAGYTDWLDKSGIASTSFDRAVKSLLKDGYVEKGEGRQDPYKPTAKAHELLNMPIVDLSAPVASHDGSGAS